MRRPGRQSAHGRRKLPLKRHPRRHDRDRGWVGPRRQTPKSQAIAAIVIGDGTLGEGLLYEALNLASLWSAPVLFVIENNRIAQTTPINAGVAGDLLSRGRAFGLESHRLDDTQHDFLERAEEIVSAVRRERRPHFLIIDTQRLGPHSKGDDHRSKDEIERIKARDPLLALRGRLRSSIAAGIERDNQTFISACSATVWRAAGRGRAKEKRVKLPSPAPAPDQSPAVTFRESLNAALRRLLAEDSKTVLIGEDLHDPYGGAFKVTAGLSSQFPERVISTPISEAAIVGAATGLAMAGFKPIVEIMFADFLGLCVDQLFNHAAKLRLIEGREAVPMVYAPPLAAAADTVQPTASRRKVSSPQYLDCWSFPLIIAPIQARS